MKAIPTAHVLLFENGRVLLVRHEKDAGHLTGTYGIPGGRQDLNESLKQTAVREFEEETGLRIEENDLVEFPNNSYTADLKRKSGEIKRYTLNAFLVKKYKGKLMPSSETTPEWISLDKVSSVNLLPNVEKAIEAAIRAR